MEAADILRITSGSRDEPIADGELLLRQGERSGALFVVVNGVFEVQRGGRGVVQISTPGAIVGELGFLLDSPASADVVAVGPASVRRIDDAARLFADVPDFARYLATLLARRLWQISTYLSDIQEQFAGTSEVIGLVPGVLQELLGSSQPAPNPGSERETDSPY